MAPTSTGHELGDCVLPSALRLVGAVREGDSKAITEAIASAREAAGDHPYWVTALLLTLAGLVPDDVSPSQLLAWNDQGDA
jgi:hypothetical protein